MSSRERRLVEVMLRVVQYVLRAATVIDSEPSTLMSARSLE
jgi:hypothetical protein